MPPTVLSLWDKIEAFADLQLEVEPTAVQGKPAGSYVTGSKGAIVLASDGSLSPSAAFHELQHIHRFWVEAVPKLQSRHHEKALGQPHLLTASERLR